MKTLFLESVAGVAGDMFSAAFVDAGLVDPEALREVPGLLGLSDVEVVLTDRTTAGMLATHLDVEVGSGTAAPGGHGEVGHGSSFAEIERLLAGSRLDDAAKEFACKVFRCIGEAEAEAHGVDLPDVHFHEVGAVDSVVDVAMAGTCIAKTAPDRVLATPVKLGRGTIRIRHGLYPVPPPASARLARGFELAELPGQIHETDVELSTPTGLAILKALSPTFTGGWPAGTVLAQGAGCGTRDLGSFPNVFRVALLETDERAEDVTAGFPRPLPYATDSVAELCYNVDDETPERVAWATEQILALGALDVWTTAVTGKKGRVALRVSVLSATENLYGIADWILRHSSTFGIRYRSWDRLTLRRHTEVREVAGKRVSHKIGRTLAGETLKEKPEFEEIKQVWQKERGPTED